MTRRGRTLLMATTMGTPAALAWEMASIVCGRTPSSAATMMMAMSVTLAPRARMAEKACGAVTGAAGRASARGTGRKGGAVQHCCHCKSPPAAASHSTP